MTDGADDDGALLREAADRLERLAARSTAGDWGLAGLLATRPEVVATRPDGRTEHVAEARAGSAPWIAAVSPEVAAPLAALLRALAAGSAAAHASGKAVSSPAEGAAGELTEVLLRRLP